MAVLIAAVPWQWSFRAIIRSLAVSIRARKRGGQMDSRTGGKYRCQSKFWDAVIQASLSTTRQIDRQTPTHFFGPCLATTHTRIALSARPNSRSRRKRKLELRDVGAASVLFFLYFLFFSLLRRRQLRSGIFARTCQQGSSLRCCSAHVSVCMYVYVYKKCMYVVCMHGLVFCVAEALVMPEGDAELDWASK
jgi:hypothetical protein